MNNFNEIKDQVDRLMDLERQKKEINDEYNEILESIKFKGVNTKALKQIVKSMAKHDEGFCSYVGALSQLTDVFYGDKG